MATSKAEAMIEKAAKELEEQTLLLLKTARKSVETAGRMLHVAANRLDGWATDGVRLEEQDVAALIAAGTNCNAAASNILRALVINKPAIQIVGAGDAQAEVGGSLIETP